MFSIKFVLLLVITVSFISAQDGELTDEVIQIVFEAEDLDNDNNMSKTEFKNLVQTILEEPTNDEKIRDIFLVFDRDGDEYFDSNEFRRMMRLETDEE